MAAHVWHVANALYTSRGFEFNSPFYPELVHEQPTLSAEDVKKKVVKLFGG